EQGMARLAELLGPVFEITPYRVNAGVSAAQGEDDDPGADAVYSIRALNTSAPYAQVVVQAKASLTPAAAKDVLLPQVRLLRRLYGQATVLVIAPWLSPRTRDVLTERQVSYLDLTGNVDLRLPTGVLIKTEGAQHNPGPTSHRRRRGLSGAAAGALARLLVDFAPPYRQKDLAAVGRVSPGYVSRVFQTLDDEALITRDGPYIVDVDWMALLRARAENYDVLHANHVTPMVTRKGPEAIYRSLISQGTGNTTAVTGSYAAREVAPVAVGGSLMFYVLPGLHMVESAASELSLLPAAGGGGNVIVLQPNNWGPLERRRPFGAAEHVGLSQLVLDCLSGPGRMPAEGEAVLAYMADTEAKWRRRRGELAQETAALC
ncbi:MAG: hypothetical protein M3R63_01590, partial [Actinomycetota bacterium]|nr:hypothetical protein [Actinomycetota bacterium]